MDMTATLRVRPESSEARPSRSRLEEAAAQLQALGFEVLHVGRFGVSVRGAGPLFSGKLGVSIDEGKAQVTEVTASEPKLAQLVDSLEYAPDADLYNSDRSR